MDRTWVLAAVSLCLAGCRSPSALADTARLDARADTSSAAADAAPVSLLESYPSQAVGARPVSEADCREAEAQAKDVDAQTQLDMNTGASGRAGMAECKMRRTYVALARRLAGNHEAVAKLESAQRRWISFRRAGDTARFPHDEPGYYGSIFPWCLSLEHEGQSLSRSDSLAAAAACHEAAADLEAAKEAARGADAELNDAYRKVRARFAKDPAFIAALTRAEQSWIAFRDAQAAFAGAAAGTPNGACATRASAGTAKARTDELRAWLGPWEEGNVCAGSYTPP
jgi:uncharacterized protein YecT (DUF1311 family)